jgi:hypothetical protein
MQRGPEWKHKLTLIYPKRGNVTVRAKLNQPPAQVIKTKYYIKGETPYAPRIVNHACVPPSGGINCVYASASANFSVSSKWLGVFSTVVTDTPVPRVAVSEVVRSVTIPRPLADGRGMITGRKRGRASTEAALLYPRVLGRDSCQRQPEKGLCATRITISFLTCHSRRIRSNW